MLITTKPRQSHRLANHVVVCRRAMSPMSARFGSDAPEGGGPS